MCVGYWQKEYLEYMQKIVKKNMLESNLPKGFFSHGIDVCYLIRKIRKFGATNCNFYILPYIRYIQSKHKFSFWLAGRLWSMNVVYAGLYPSSSVFYGKGLQHFVMTYFVCLLDGPWSVANFSSFWHLYDRYFSMFISCPFSFCCVACFLIYERSVVSLVISLGLNFG